MITVEKVHSRVDSVEHYERCTPFTALMLQIYYSAQIAYTQIFFLHLIHLLIPKITVLVKINLLS
jgi:hypothetical protein